MSRRVRFLLGLAGATLLSAFASAGERVLVQEDFAAGDGPGSWQRWSPRAEIAPAFAHATTGGRTGAALTITTRGPAEFGAWRRQVGGIQPAETYRITAWHRTEGVANPQRSVIARVEWLDANGRPVKVSVRPPEYIGPLGAEHGWTKLESVLQAPAGAAALDLQLSLAFAPGGTVWWDDLTVTAIPAPAPRRVRAMTVHFRPRNLPSAAANVEAFCAQIRQAADQKPDIICLPEGMTVVGTRRSYVDVSEPVPGPTTERLGALARELNCYIVAGLYEREAPAVYNTAVLIDRTGRLAGRYRKTHLPREEWEAGLTPGDTYPVFQTDFGTLGILVCWDLQFPEPWRALGLQGAELVLLPIWGGSDLLLRGRALENHAYVVSSSYDMRSCVVAPNGEILAEASTQAPVATAEIDLDAKLYQPWLGDMRTRTWKERRGELPNGREAVSGRR